MKYVLITSISTKCRLLTHKVNFVVTTAFRYALRATYFSARDKTTARDKMTLREIKKNKRGKSGAGVRLTFLLIKM